MTRLDTTEGAFQKSVIDFAHYKGWRVLHIRPARTKDGWRTPISADGQGYPDLTLFRERTIWVECKREGEELSNWQVIWKDWIIDAGGEYYCWRPSDWREIEKVLTNEGRAVVE